MRDPDNTVVKLFQAKAMDEQKLANLETSVSALFNHPSDTPRTAAQDRSLRTLVNQKILMEMLKEKQSVVRGNLESKSTPQIQTTPAPVPAQTDPSSLPQNLEPVQPASPNSNTDQKPV